MNDEQYKPLTCTEIEEHATLLAQNSFHNKIELCHLFLVCFQDKEFKDFLERKSLDIELIAKRLEGLYNNIPPVPLTGVSLSRQSRKVLSKAHEWVDKDDTHYFDSSQSLSLLFALLDLNSNDKEAKNEVAALFLDAGITVDVVGSYIFGDDDHNKHYLSDNVLSKIHISSNYTLTGETQGKKYDPVIRKDSDSALFKYCSCFNDMVHEGRIDPVIGRDDEVHKIIQIIRQRHKNNPLLVGEPGVGKTAIVEKLALMSNSGQLPEDIGEMKIINLDLAALVDGTMYRGDFEKRLRAVLDSVMYIENAYLFIDETHMIMGAGSASGSAMDASNILKPYLARDIVKVIGATTSREYKKYLEKDDAITRRFRVVDVPEPTPEETIEMLHGLKSGYEKHHRCKITDKAIEAAVALSVRHIHDRNLPDKAKDLLDVAGAYLQDERKDVLLPELEENMVIRAISKECGIPLENMEGHTAQKALNLASELKKAVFNQDQAADSVEQGYVRYRAGLSDHNKPIGSFLFTGPTGVGKTELSKQLALYLGVPLIRFDMSEYSEHHTVSNLIGSPKGYVGYSEGGLLTEAVRRNRHCVLLLDEIEKAHPEIFNTFLQVMDEGQLKDRSGLPVDFRNVILIMTSNAGAQVQVKRGIGFNATENTEGKQEAVNKIFSPEFRNRLSDQIEFNRLSKDVMPQLVDKLLQDLQKEKLNAKNVTISMTAEARDWLAEKGYDEAMGARPLKRVFQRHVETPISYKMMRGDISGTSVVIARNDEDGLDLKFSVDSANSNQLLALPSLAHNKLQRH